MKKLYAILGAIVAIEVISIVVLTCTGFGRSEFNEAPPTAIIETDKPSEKPVQTEVPTNTPSIQPTSTPEQNTQIVTEDGVVIEVVHEMVEGRSNVSIRESYSTSAKKVGTLAGGSEILRTGICDNGWSEVEYKGEKAYIKSDYLMKDGEETSPSPTKTPTVSATPKAKITN